MYWYAVMSGKDDDDWGTGSFDRKYALSLLAKFKQEYGDDAYIAVINDATKVCVGEIHKVETVYRYYLPERPPVPGSIPKGGIVDVHDGKVMWGTFDFYGYVDYNRELTDKEVSDYELIAGGIVDEQGSLQCVS